MRGYVKNHQMLYTVPFGSWASTPPGQTARAAHEEMRAVPGIASLRRPIFFPSAVSIFDAPKIRQKRVAGKVPLFRCCWSRFLCFPHGVGLLEIVKAQRHRDWIDMETIHAANEVLLRWATSEDATVNLCHAKAAMVTKQKII